MGFLIGPVIHMLLEFEPEIVYQAVGYTTIAFTSFTGISLFSKRRSYLFLGGIIMTMMQLMFFYRILGYFMGNQIGLPYLMCGLFMACMFIIYDT
jgi:FtsH-binding integral membrane protein